MQLLETALQTMKCGEKKKPEDIFYSAQTWLSRRAKAWKHDYFLRIPFKEGNESGCWATFTISHALGVEVRV